jgi:UDP-N-acetylglucosamine 2-epimerase (non-hydrolysing)
LILLTGHRRENFGENFLNLCSAIEKILLLFNCQVVLPVHPNGQLRKAIENKIKPSSLLHLIEPLGYSEFVFLMKRSDLIITDSGGIQEEAPSIQKHVIVTRNVTERMDGVSTGYIHLTGCDPAKIIETTRMIFEIEQKPSFVSNPFGDGDAADKITKCLIDISRMQESWCNDQVD